MKLVMTLMVRDEADIISAMLDHHIAQGVDKFIVTDNGSTDGTREILENYASRGILDLRHDPVHRKQQGERVTEMARDAKILYAADWVLNADADEFWVPLDRSLTLKDAFSHIDPSLGSFPVPVIDMTGPPSLEGTGLQRLTIRDPRGDRELQKVGLLRQSTHNAAHVGDEKIVISQGNHFVSIESKGLPTRQWAVEVLHYPWRSWNQFSRKVRNAGEGYAANPDLKPSPNHHGMRDFARLQEGTLLAHYVARSVLKCDLDTDSLRGWEQDLTIAERHPSPVLDEPIQDELELALIGRGRTVVEFVDMQIERYSATLQEERAELNERISALEHELGMLRSRRAVRFADALSRRFRH